jgi:hypothetical protein
MAKKDIDISIKDGKRTIKFADDERYEIDSLEKTMETLKDYEIKEFSHVESFFPSASSWFNRFKQKINNCNKKNKETIVVSEKLTTSQIKNIIKIPSSNWLFADADYYVADIPSLLAQMKKYNVAGFKYEFPYYDCDDFSFAAMGAIHLNKETAKMAAFIIWVSYQRDGKNYSHALNGACTGDKFYLIEPQNYGVFEIPIGYVLRVLIG